MITTYHDLPLGTWLEIQALPYDPIDDTDYRIRVLSLLTGLSERDILYAPIAQVHEWARQAAFLERDAPEAGRIARAYQAGPYKLIPTADLRKVTTAQYIDFQTFAPGGEEKLVELLSVFLIPEGCKYNDGYDIAAVQQAIRQDLTVADAVALSAFFLTRYAALIRNSRISLARLLKREKDPGKREAIRARLAELEKLTESLLTVSPPAGGGSPASTT